MGGGDIAYYNGRSFIQVGVFIAFCRTFFRVWLRRMEGESLFLSASSWNAKSFLIEFCIVSSKLLLQHTIPTVVAREETVPARRFDVLTKDWGTVDWQAQRNSFVILNLPASFELGEQKNSRVRSWWRRWKMALLSLTFALLSREEGNLFRRSFRSTDWAICCLTAESALHFFSSTPHVLSLCGRGLKNCQHNDENLFRLSKIVVW